jgi:hypothetical protein
MAIRRKTLDVDLLTLRKVNIRGDRNSVVPSTSVLMSDGVGGTYWSLVSSLGTYPTFQQIIVDCNIYSATPSSQSFTIISGNGIGFLDAGPGSNATYIYAKAFQTLGVSGLSSINAVTNGVVTPNINLAATGGLQLSTDTTSQTIYFNAGLKYVNVVQNLPAFSTNLATAPYTPLTITPQQSTLAFYGIGDINVYADSPSNSIYVGINGYTAQNYVNLSNTVYSLSNSMIGYADSRYVNKLDFSTGLMSLSTDVGRQLSSYQILSTYLTLSTYTMSNVSTLSTLYSSLSTSVSFNISSLSSYFYAVNQSTLSTFIYNQLTSTVVGYSSIYSTITYAQVTSTLSSLNAFAVSSLSLQSTTTNLSWQISSVAASSIVLTQNSLSTMSTAMTSSFISYFNPRLNILSSLGYSGIRGDNTKFTFDANGQLLISTVEFSFKDLTSSIRSSRADISLEYNPVLLFPMASGANIVPQNVSTYIQYKDGTILNNVTFSDYMSFNQYSAGAGADGFFSNLYSKHIRMSIDAGFVMSNGVSNYTVYHRLSTTSLYINGLSQAFNSTCHIRTPVQNSLYLNLFNKD